MSILEAKTFLMWWTIIDAVLLMFSAAICVFLCDWIYRIQSRWFAISRETFNVAVYSYIGLFKIIFIVFNVAPYIALLIIA